LRDEESLPLFAQKILRRLTFNSEAPQNDCAFYLLTMQKEQTHSSKTRHRVILSEAKNLFCFSLNRFFVAKPLIAGLLRMTAFLLTFETIRRKHTFFKKHIPVILSEAKNLFCFHLKDSSSPCFQ